MNPQLPSTPSRLPRLRPTYRIPHTAHRIPHTAYRIPHTAYHTPHTAYHTPHTAYHLPTPYPNSQLHIPTPNSTSQLPTPYPNFQLQIPTPNSISQLPTPESHLPTPDSRPRRLSHPHPAPRLSTLHADRHPHPHARRTSVQRVVRKAAARVRSAVSEHCRCASATSQWPLLYSTRPCCCWIGRTSAMRSR